MKIGIIPFSHILSLSLQQYIDDNTSSFIKDDNDKYILTKNFKNNKLSNLINDIMMQEISKMNQDVVYIVGECYLYNNYRMHLEYNLIKPEHKQLVDEKYPIKYILKERNDIKIDDLKFNHISDIFFTNHFKKQTKDIKFLKHRHLTENDLIYIFKNLFSDNVLNIIDNSNCILEKINDLVYFSKVDQIDKKYIKIINFLIEEQFNIQ